MHLLGSFYFLTWRHCQRVRLVGPRYLKFKGMSEESGGRMDGKDCYSDLVNKHNQSFESTLGFSHYQYVY